MKLNWSQIRAIIQLTDLFAKIGKDQKTLVEAIGDGIKAADLSRAKKGYVPQKKWETILSKFQKIAQGESKPAHIEVASEISRVIEKLRRNVESPASIDDAAYAGYPDLQLAALARRYNQDLNPSVWNVAPPTLIYTVQMNYPEEPRKTNPEFLKRLIGEKWEEKFEAIRRLKSGLQTFQRKVRAAIVDVNASSGESKILPLPTESGFRGLLSPARIQTTPLIYLIPFFLTADRRFDYGVVRYGCHRNLCLLLSRTTLKGALGDEPDNIGREEFTKLIDVGLKLFHVEPYSAEHILSQMLLEFQDEDILSRFNQANMPPENDFKVVIERLASDPGNSLLVFESADQFVIADHLSQHGSGFEDHKIIQLKHGVEIDVGLGYSLRAFDWIVTHDRFKALRSKAMSSIDEFRDYMQHIGIEIDPVEKKKKMVI